MTPAHQLKNLWEACGSGDDVKVRRLLSRHSVCRDNPHALWVAVSTNHPSCVQALLPHAQLRPYPKIWLHIVDQKKGALVDVLRPFLSPVSFSSDLFSLAALHDFRPYLQAALPLADTRSILAAFDVAVCESNEWLQDLLYPRIPDPSSVLKSLILQGLSPSQVKHLTTKVECDRQKKVLELAVGENTTVRARKM